MFFSWSWCANTKTTEDVLANLAQLPTKQVERRRSVCSSSSLNANAPTILSFSGWGSKNSDDKTSGSNTNNGKGPDGGPNGTGELKPTKRGVPGLNQPEPRGKPTDQRPQHPP